MMSMESAVVLIVVLIVVMMKPLEGHINVELEIIGIKGLLVLLLSVNFSLRM